MKVHEFAKWLLEFEDQEAEVEIVVHLREGSYYEQGGYATTEDFDPSNKDHYSYSDLRGNPYIQQDNPAYNNRYLLIGCIDG